MVIKMNMYDFLKQFNDIDMDDIEKVKLLADNFMEWCRWNKSYETIEVIKPKNFVTIIVIHNLWERHLSIYNSWDFLKDVIYFLEEYSDNDDNYDYMFNFWNDKLNGLMK